jgi:hypothetical protein
LEKKSKIKEKRLKIKASFLKAKSTKEESLKIV